MFSRRHPEIEIPQPQLSLLPNVLTGATAVQADLTKMGASWRRTIGLQWGPLVGTFRIEGDESKLAEYMHTWLGYHLEERAGGRVTWEGIVVDLTLHSRVVRRRSLENLWNRVRVGTGNLVRNGSFETLDPGANTFLHWQQTGGVSIETDANTGARAAQPDAANSIYQDIEFDGGGAFRVSFYALGSATADPEYSIDSLPSLSPIVPNSSSGITNNAFRRVTEEFTLHSSRTGIRVRLRSPSGGAVIFDDVEVRRIEEGQQTLTYTDWAEIAESISAFGTKELSIDTRETGLAEAVRIRDNELNHAAWPRLERLSQPGRGGVAVLEGVAIGYGLTTGWVYAQHDMFFSHDEAGSTMETLLGEAEYIQSIIVHSNTELVRLERRQKRLRDAIEEVVAGAGNSNYWRVYVRPGRTAVFEQIDFAPKYYLQGGLIRSSLNGPLVNPYTVTPGIVRDVAYPHGADYPDSPYQDRRDFYLEEVIVDNGSLDWSIGDF